jgi:uncharacterized membrane protein
MGISSMIYIIASIWLGAAFLVSGFRLKSTALKMLGVLSLAWTPIIIFRFVGYIEIATVILVIICGVYVFYINSQKVFKDLLYGKLDIVRILLFQDTQKKDV